MDSSICQVPRNVGALPDRISLPARKPMFPPQPSAIVSTFLPSFSLLSSTPYRAFDSVHYPPMPMRRIVRPGHQNQQQLEKNLVYPLSTNLSSMSLLVIPFPPSQSTSPMSTRNGGLTKKARKCQRCGTTGTPEWRRGPNGPHTLCNACGLFYAKLVKKNGAATATGEVFNNKVNKGSNSRWVTATKVNLDRENYKRFD